MEHVKRFFTGLAVLALAAAGAGIGIYFWKPILLTLACALIVFSTYMLGASMRGNGANHDDQ